MTSIRALTICQPHATNIITGVKRIENRTWRRDYSGPLIIHAGARWDTYHPLARDMPRGALGVVRSIAYHRAEECEDAAQLRQWADGAFECTEVGGIDQSWARPGRTMWHWTLYGAIAFPEPISCVGRMGFWTPPAHVADVAARLLEGETTT